VVNAHRRALADTSLLIGVEAERLDADLLRDYELGVSAVTLGELRLGVLQARDPAIAAQRLSTYQIAQRFEPLVIDEAVSEAWALLVSQLRAAGRKAPINDTWIAATAIAHNIPIVSQDADYDHMPNLQVILVS
jgi:predicted nucleic acid-binding protein